MNICKIFTGRGFGVWPFLVAFLMTLAPGWSANPAWWSASSGKEQTRTSAVLDTATAADTAVATKGQVMHMAQKAMIELDKVLAPDLGGVGKNIQNLFTSYNAATNNEVIAIGQLKYVSSLFWLRLREVGAPGAPLKSEWPFQKGGTKIWSSATNDDNDTAAATLGQVKMAFSFDIPSGKPASREFAAGRTALFWPGALPASGSVTQGILAKDEVLPLHGGPDSSTASIYLRAGSKVNFAGGCVVGDDNAFLILSKDQALPYSPRVLNTSWVQTAPARMVWLKADTQVVLTPPSDALTVKEGSNVSVAYSLVKNGTLATAGFPAGWQHDYLYSPQTGGTARLDPGTFVEFEQLEVKAYKKDNSGNAGADNGNTGAYIVDSNHKTVQGVLVRGTLGGTGAVAGHHEFQYGKNTYQKVWLLPGSVAMFNSRVLHEWAKQATANNLYAKAYSINSDRVEGYLTSGTLAAVGPTGKLFHECWYGDQPLADNSAKLSVPLAAGSTVLFKQIAFADKFAAINTETGEINGYVQSSESIGAGLIDGILAEPSTVSLTDSTSIGYDFFFGSQKIDASHSAVVRLTPGTRVKCQQKILNKYIYFKSIQTKNGEWLCGFIEMGTLASPSALKEGLLSYPYGPSADRFVTLAPNTEVKFELKTDTTVSTEKNASADFAEGYVSSGISDRIQSLKTSETEYDTAIYSEKVFLIITITVPPATGGMVPCQEIWTAICCRMLGKSSISWTRRVPLEQMAGLAIRQRRLGQPVGISGEDRSVES